VASLSTTDIFQFDRFHLDRRGLFRRDEGAVPAPVEIGSRALDVLRMLLERPGELVSRDEIMAAAWPKIVVEDNNLTIQIAALRRVLDRERANGSCIQTVPRRGYRFVAPVRRVDVDAHATVSRGSGRPRLSIVVLPFANPSDDREQQYCADGITEDLTTDLARLDSFVISHIDRNKLVDAGRIGRELGVGYVVDGTVRRAGKQIRVTVRLIDAVTDALLWAERFDRDAGNFFATQSEITGRITNSLGIELIAAEAARPNERPEALDYIVRGRAASLKPPARASRAEQVSLLERALALDPRSAEAQSVLADALANRVLDRVTDTAAADLARAEELVDRALAASPRSPTAHLARGVVLRARDRCEEAIPEYEMALAINPNAAAVLDVLADCKLLTGSIEEVIPLAEQAIRLSPLDPRIGYFYMRIGHVHLLQSCPDEAITWLERARGAAPEMPFVHALLAAAHGLRGDIERAAPELAKGRRLAAANRWSSIAHLRAVGYWGVPKVRAMFESTYLAGLRKAGMPEE